MQANIVVLMTAHNRAELTEACLRSLSLQTVPVAHVLLIDDGSSDDTSERAEAAYPGVLIHRGAGDLYWAGGMRKAYGLVELSRFDFVLWLNDDVELDADAVEQLISTYEAVSESRNEPIVVGTLLDRSSDSIAYSGVRQGRGLHRLRFAHIEPQGRPQPADTMNGNVVLIPWTVTEEVGGFDPNFTHGMADYDYGLRAKKLGHEVWIAAKPIGRCASNRGSGAAMAKGSTPWKRLRSLLSVKGLPHPDWMYFCRRHGGMFWPVIWISPYIKATLPRRSIGFSK